MEFGALFDLFNALSHLSLRRLLRRKAFAYTDWCHAF
jgi:hypothetical protein